MIDVETAKATILHVFDWRYAFHISAPLNSPFCIVSLDCPTKDLPSQVWKVPFDGTLAELICEPGSVFTGYNSELKAAVSADGSKIVGCSNFGKTTDPNYCDVFMINLTQPDPNVFVPSITTDNTQPSETDAHGEVWLNMGTLPFDESSDLVSFNSTAKSVTIYRRK